MALRQTLRHPAVFGLFASITGLWWVASGCSTENPSSGSGGAPGNTGGAAAGPSTGGTGAGATGGAAAGPASGGTGAGMNGSTGGVSSTGETGGSSAGGAATGGASVDCTPEATIDRQHVTGNYDNVSCNKPDCHQGYVGGWLYASAKGYPWVAGATITITNTDGTTLTSISGADGFFDFGIFPAISSPYEVCASKCPSTDCNITTHTSVDCLSANCHSLKTQRIYVTTPNVGGTGGAGTVPGENCAQPAPGGPYVHGERYYNPTDGDPCVSCHRNVTPNYEGGFLYDAPDSTTTVAEATVTLKPDAGGSPVTAITGPDGMFFFGTYGQTTTAAEIPAGYIACVSKCPLPEICSPAGTHPTNADCGTCHDGATTGKVYLR